MASSPAFFTVEQPSVAVLSTDARFPVRRIYCIGRNYAAHAREMGSDPVREPPFFFQKPGDAIFPCPPHETVDHPYPPLTSNYHHEIELVVALASGGRNIAAETALSHVFGYAVGLDMTRRDRQNEMKAQGKPWEIGKAFDRSAPLGPIVPVGRAGHLAKGVISLSINGKVKQQADLSQMIWSVAEQIAQLSMADELCAGDIIFCGTPDNVGPVEIGDRLIGHIGGLPDLALRITPPL